MFTADKRFLVFSKEFERILNITAYAGHACGLVAMWVTTYSMCFNTNADSILSWIKIYVGTKRFQNGANIGKYVAVFCSSGCSSYAQERQQVFSFLWVSPFLVAPYTHCA